MLKDFLQIWNELLCQMCLPKDVETQKKHLMLSVFSAEILLSLFVYFLDSIGP